jgi:hypothetical protein
MLSLQSPFGHSKLPSVEGTGYATVKCAISYETADGAVLFTVPSGCRLRLARAYWHVTTPFAGGSSSAIGVDSSNAAYATAGDLLGGASGDLEAALTAGFKGGTIGAKFGSNGVIVLDAGDTVRFQRIASAFTSGVGFVVLEFVAVQDV